jgi:hypothetical protein
VRSAGTWPARHALHRQHVQQRQAEVEHGEEGEEGVGAVRPAPPLQLDDVLQLVDEGLLEQQDLEGGEAGEEAAAAGGHVTTIAPSAGRVLDTAHWSPAPRQATCRHAGRATFRPAAACDASASPGLAFLQCTMEQE